MTAQTDSTMEQLEAAKRLTEKGGEYWLGRKLQEILGYTKWENFESVIDKAKEACRLSGVEVEDHFLDTRKVITAGKGAQLERGDYFVTRYGCYLIAMNGDPGKAEIASAQTYFAVQTRRQELRDENALLEKRFQLRNRVTDAVAALNATAKEAGVQSYGLFQHAGYKGLYQMGLADIKTRKGIEQKEELFDRCGPTELAANEFRLTQAQEKIKREGITGQQSLMNAHEEVGKKVRDAIAKIGGTMPENLHTEPSLKKLVKEREKAAKLEEKKKLSPPKA